MLISYVPYIRDILRGKTQPHIYTWLIWLITQGTASAAAFYGGSFYTSFGLFAGTLMVLVICLLSARYGTKNITKGDTITLALALSAVLVWWKLDNPLFAVVMVSAIDGFGYLPSFRKTYEEPASETSSFWILIAASTLFTLLANQEFNILTSLYLSVMFICNFIMFSLSDQGIRNYFK
jgi:hypothetical protein